MHDLPLHPRVLVGWETVPTWSSRSADEGREMPTGQQECLAKGQSTAEGGKRASKQNQKKVQSEQEEREPQEPAVGEQESLAARDPGRCGRGWGSPMRQNGKSLGLLS